MRRWQRPRGAIAVVGGAVTAMAAVFATASPVGAAPAPVQEVQLAVKLTSGASLHAAETLSGLPGSVPKPAIGDRWRLRVPAGEVAATLQRLRSKPGVQYASVVQRVRASDTVNDPCYQSIGCGPATPPVFQVNEDQYGNFHYTPAGPVSQTDLAQVGAPSAWSITHGSANVLVAVLDTGVNANQEDLVGKVTAGPNIVCTVDGYDCLPSTTDTDDNGHGTHVTGTVAANTNNAVGVASLGYDTHAETFKVLDGSGSGTTFDVATGIREAVDTGAKVISMSLGNTPCSVDSTSCGPDPDTQAAVEYAQQHNVVVVAAAGNDGVNDPAYPAGYPGVLSVAAVDPSGATTSYSNWGGAANIAAPGDNILSTWNTSPPGYPTTFDNGTYALLSGTSMATPHVAAAAALMLAVAPSLDAAHVVSALETTASPIARGNPIDGGLLDTPAALQAAMHGGGVYGGYQLAGADGSVYSFGATPDFGDLSGTTLNKPVVAAADLGDKTGYWLAASDGGVFTFGNAPYHGSAGNIPLNAPVVGMAATPDGNGYWLVASDGGIFTYGDAHFYGSTGNIRLNKPIVGMAVDPATGGYWLVASDGGIFSFNAPFLGSTGNIRLNKPIVGMAVDPATGGYWLVASDGGIFSFNAPFHGSTGAMSLNEPIIGMRATSDGGGYWLAARDGGIFTFGDARFEGSTGGQSIPAPIVAVTG